MELSDIEYKLAKEAHVANCTGGSIYEISLLGSVVPASHAVWIALTKSKRINPDSYINQFIIYVIPILLSTTVLSNYVPVVVILLGMIAYVGFRDITVKKSDEKKEKKTEEYKSYMTIYRAGTMMLTCVAILAVDFQIFPRRYAKVEDFGTSLMDIGVGSFVFSSGVVASRSYLRGNKDSLMKSLVLSIRSALPLLVLGFARFFLTKSVNYQEHNSEYGLHWNFFITLGLLPPFVTLISFLRRIAPFSILGLAVAITYQSVLMNGLEDWILNAPRTDMISANKEGISSFSGYLSIFLLGLECGTIIFQKKELILTRWKVRDCDVVGLNMFIYGSIMWIMYYIWIYLLPAYAVSRREANLPYILWVVGFNSFLISSVIMMEHRYGYSEAVMMDSMNRNGLFTFLLANILTGIINLSIRTLYTSASVSLLILTVYMLTVTYVPTVLWHKYHIRIKL
ncbi:GWT1-domain-containing protein [Pilobolus umbonatus]|nr:GWT1-domain-containing protein [Pilobolus umbonatus]